jgi:hypothetical protein
MICQKAIWGTSVLALVFLLGVQALCAQEAPQEPSEEKPKPAARSTPIPLVDAGNQEAESVNRGDQLQPDFTPLTGLQTPTLGNPEIRHSFWVPGIQYASYIQSNAVNQSKSSGWFVDNYLIGNLSLLKAWSRSQLAMNYSGGGFFSSDSTQGNGYYQQLALDQNFQWNRWLVQILDQFSYLPQLQFGFGVGTNLGVPGVSGTLGPNIPGLGTSFIPNQSIYTAFGPRYTNAAAIQVTYALSPRGSITATGSYGILRFVDPGNVNDNMAIASIGYNYAFSRENNLGIVYRFSSFHYPGQPQAFGVDVINLAFSRKVTGHMALQLFAGPQFTTFRVPIDAQTSKLGANAGGTLTYAFQNGGITAGFLHGLTGGSGVLTGSTVNLVNIGANRKLGRVWTVNGNFGYVNNTPVVSSTASNFPSYNSWYAGAGVNRPFGRNLNLAVAYSITINNYGQSGCTGPSCSQTNNYITVNLQWHTRPLVLP